MKSRNISLETPRNDPGSKSNMAARCINSVKTLRCLCSKSHSSELNTQNSRCISVQIAFAQRSIGKCENYSQQCNSLVCNDGHFTPLMNNNHWGSDVWTDNEVESLLEYKEKPV